jgi:4-hydroxy-2-oxoheptanedioate aldolase
MRPNRLRQLLRAGRPSVGTHVHASWPTVVEVLGHTHQYDYVEFSGEYAPYDLHGLDDFCRAAELLLLGTMIKLDQEPRTWLAQRAIGAGFQSVLFADVRTADDARACVRAARPDTPTGGGTYGAADRLISYWNEAATQGYIDAIADTVVVLRIEKRVAVDQLDDILAVPGVDMIQWGPADYAMSVGRPGGWFDPDIKAVEREVIARALAAGVVPRVEITDPAEAEPYLELGVRHFCIGTDLQILYAGWRERGAALRELLGVEPPGPSLDPATPGRY